MKNICIPSNCEKISESDNESVYVINSDDKFIKMICNRYNIKLCLVIQKENSNIQYICMYHYNYAKMLLTFPFYMPFFFRSVSFKKDTTNQFIAMHSDFLNKYDSFQMNVDECIESLKGKIVNALKCGFNTLSEYIKNSAEDFGTLPCGSSENEILMKMKLMV